MKVEEGVAFFVTEHLKVLFILNRYQPFRVDIPMGEIIELLVFCVSHVNIA